MQYLVTILILITLSIGPMVKPDSAHASMDSAMETMMWGTFGLTMIDGISKLGSNSSGGGSGMGGGGGGMMGGGGGMNPMMMMMMMGAMSGKGGGGGNNMMPMMMMMMMGGGGMGGGTAGIRNLAMMSAMMASQEGSNNLMKGMSAAMLVAGIGVTIAEMNGSIGGGQGGGGGRGGYAGGGGQPHATVARQGGQPYATVAGHGGQPHATVVGPDGQSYTTFTGPQGLKYLKGANGKVYHSGPDGKLFEVVGVPGLGDNVGLPGIAGAGPASFGTGAANVSCNTAVYSSDPAAVSRTENEEAKIRALIQMAVLAQYDPQDFYEKRKKGDKKRTYKDITLAIKTAKKYLHNETRALKDRAWWRNDMEGDDIIASAESIDKSFVGAINVQKEKLGDIEDRNTLMLINARTYALMFQKIQRNASELANARKRKIDRMSKEIKSSSLLLDPDLPPNATPEAKQKRVTETSHMKTYLVNALEHSEHVLQCPEGQQQNSDNEGASAEDANAEDTSANEGGSEVPPKPCDRKFEKKHIYVDGLFNCLYIGEKCKKDFMVKDVIAQKVLLKSKVNLHPLIKDGFRKLYGLSTKKKKSDQHSFLALSPSKLEDKTAAALMTLQPFSDIEAATDLPGRVARYHQNLRNYLLHPATRAPIWSAIAESLDLVTRKGELVDAMLHNRRCKLDEITEAAREAEEAIKDRE
ncbi:MAG: hypothetical protein ISR65_11755 [Bacteriovoracaceae bacterium]|nr:hypothetical protein [Bacteriovoracaceae bacterium]